jgi:hypothetical protein
LSQALLAPKQLNLNKLGDAGGLKFGGCSTPSKTNFSMCFGINSRNRIDAAWMKRVAFADALQDQPKAFPPMLFDCFDPVVGAAWKKSAAISEKGTNRILVESDR